MKENNLPLAGGGSDKSWGEAYSISSHDPRSGKDQQPLIFTNPAVWNLVRLAFTVPPPPVLHKGYSTTTGLPELSN